MTKCSIRTSPLSVDEDRGSRSNDTHQAQFLGPYRANIASEERHGWR